MKWLPADEMFLHISCIESEKTERDREYIYGLESRFRSEKKSRKNVIHPGSNALQLLCYCPS